MTTNSSSVDRFSPGQVVSLIDGDDTLYVVVNVTIKRRWWSDVSTDVAVIPSFGQLSDQPIHYQIDQLQVASWAEIDKVLKSGRGALIALSLSLSRGDAE